MNRTVRTVLALAAGASASFADADTIYLQAGDKSGEEEKNSF